MATQQHIDKENTDTPPAYITTERQESVGMRALAGLFLLEHEFRNVPDNKQLARLVVNRLNRFAPYDCAVFWLCRGPSRFDEITISGLASAKQEAGGRKNQSALAWGQAVAHWLGKSKWANTPITPDLIEDKTILEIWPKNMPKAGLYVPLYGRDGKLRGGIFLVRQNGWSQPVRVMLDQIADAAAYTIDALEAGVHRGYRWRRLAVPFALGLGVIIGLTLLAAIFFAPVPDMVREPIEAWRSTYFE